MPGVVPPLILEPTNWNGKRAVLRETADGLDGALRSILEVLDKGLVRFPTPERGESAAALLRCIVDLYGSTKARDLSEIELARVVNLQYQAMLTVHVLVPPTMLAERFERLKKAREAQKVPAL
jgi:hypothetical protein